ncbi:MAG: alpha/beta hydrolase [Nakamurella sp.]
MSPPPPRQERPLFTRPSVRPIPRRPRPVARRRRPLLFAGITAGLVLTLAAGCTVGPSSRPDLAVFGDVPAASSTPTSIPLGPGGPGQPGEFAGGWQSCESLDDPIDGASAFETACARMLVPVDRAAPTGTDLAMQVGRARRSGLPADAPTLVVVDAAGPLEGALAGANRVANIAATLPRAITDRYQVVVPDVRGAVSSGVSTCWRDYPLTYLYTLDADPTATGAAARLLDVTRAFTFGCQDYVGPEMAFFGTAQAADDLDSLRSALQQDRLDLLGTGYGATLGAVYADRYPGRVGRLALDSPSDHAAPPADRAVTSAAGYEKSLQAFTADCATRADCALGTDATTATAALTTAMTTLDAGGISTDDVTLGSSAALWALIMALPDRSRWPALATAIAETARGDGTALTDLLSSLVSDPRAAVSARTMLDCNDSDERLADSDLPTRFADARTTAPTFGAFLVAVASLCRQWPTPDAPLAALRGEGAAPVLVVGGIDDPVAPGAGARAVAGQLASAQLISYPGPEHGGYRRSDCVTTAVDNYLLDGTLPAADTLCPA